MLISFNTLQNIRRLQWILQGSLVGPKSASREINKPIIDFSWSNSCVTRFQTKNTPRISKKLNAEAYSEIALQVLEELHQKKPFRIDCEEAVLRIRQEIKNRYKDHLDESELAEYKDLPVEKRKFYIELVRRVVDLLNKAEGLKIHLDNWLGQMEKVEDKIRKVQAKLDVLEGQQLSSDKEQIERLKAELKKLRNDGYDCASGRVLHHWMLHKDYSYAEHIREIYGYEVSYYALKYAMDKEESSREVESFEREEFPERVQINRDVLDIDNYRKLMEHSYTRWRNKTPYIPDISNIQSKYNINSLIYFSEL